MIRIEYKKLLLVALIGIILSQVSCGFRLRGEVNIAAELLPIAIVAEGVYIQLTPVLRHTLQGAGLSVVEPNFANSVLRLRYERYEKKLLTVATSGESQTHSIQYTIQFDIVKSKANMTALAEVNNPILNSLQANSADAKQTSPLGEESSKQVVSVTRTFQFEKKAVLSSAAEEAIIKKEMLDDAAQQILRRLNYVKSIQELPGQLQTPTENNANSQLLLPK